MCAGGCAWICVCVCVCVHVKGPPWHSCTQTASHRPKVLYDNPFCPCFIFILYFSFSLTYFFHSNFLHSVSLALPRVLSLLTLRRNKSAWFSFRNVPRCSVSVSQIVVCQWVSPCLRVGTCVCMHKWIWVCVDCFIEKIQIIIWMSNIWWTLKLYYQWYVKAHVLIFQNKILIWSSLVATEEKEREKRNIK